MDLSRFVLALFSAPLSLLTVVAATAAPITPGDLVVSDANNKAIWRVDPSGSTSLLYTTGLQPISVAVAPDGGVFWGAGTEVFRDGFLVGSVPGKPVAMTVGTDNDLYVAVESPDRLIRILLDQPGAPREIVAEFPAGGLTGVATRGNDIIVSDFNNHAIWSVDTGTGDRLQIYSSTLPPISVASGLDGSVYWGAGTQVYQNGSVLRSLGDKALGIAAGSPDELFVVTESPARVLGIDLAAPLGPLDLIADFPAGGLTGIAAFVVPEPPMAVVLVAGACAMLLAMVETWVDRNSKGVFRVNAR